MHWNWKQVSLLDHLKLHLQGEAIVAITIVMSAMIIIAPYNGQCYWRGEVGVVSPPKPSPLEGGGRGSHPCTSLAHLELS